MDEIRGSGMVQDTGGDSDQGLERDAGWQAFKESATKDGNYDYTIDYLSSTLRVVYSYDSEYGYENDPDQYVVVNNVFVGDDHALFEITDLLEEITLEDLAIRIQTEIDNEAFDAS